MGGTTAEKFIGQMIDKVADRSNDTSLRCRPTEGNHEDSLPPNVAWNVKLCHSSVRFGTVAQWGNTVNTGVQWASLI